MSSNWDVEFAKQLKIRDNPEKIGAVLGDVISNNPLRIAIYNNEVILSEEQCYLCKNVINSNVINGDKVLCLPTSNGQAFFIIDTVVV